MRGIFSKTGLAVSGFAQAGLLATTIIATPDVQAAGNTIEEGERVPADEMSQALKENNMRIYATGDFSNNVEGGDTPNDPTDDSVDLNIAVFAATPDGSDVWILKGDTPKSADTSDYFTVVEKARDLRIVDNESTPQRIPYEEGLYNPKANQFCQMLTDPERAPEGFDYFLENDIDRCASFEQVMQRGPENGTYIYAQALSRAELEDGKMTQTVITISNMKELPNSMGFIIEKSFVGTSVTHPVHPVDGGIHMEWTQHAERLKQLQSRQASYEPGSN